MTVNAEQSQPQVRSGTLPTNTPRTVQRAAQPQAAQPAQTPAEGAETAQATGEAGPEKPKRKYNRRNPPRAKSAGLTQDEFAVLAQIALEANTAGVPVAEFMTKLEQDVGLKLQVWAKVKPAAAGAPAAPAEASEPTVEA